MTKVRSRDKLVWHGNDLCLPSGAVIARITQDAQFPPLWRIIYRDGRVGDGMNKVRAKDAASAYAQTVVAPA
jgi:hypothetical protein